MELSEVVLGLIIFTLLDFSSGFSSVEAGSGLLDAFALIYSLATLDTSALGSALGGSGLAEFALGSG